MKPYTIYAHIISIWMMVGLLAMNTQSWAVLVCSLLNGAAAVLLLAAELRTPNRKAATSPQSSAR